MMDAREQLMKDYRIAQDLLENILEGILPNHKVIGHEYFNPSVSEEIIPLNADAGLFMHYMIIRDGIEVALTRGKIPWTLVPDGAPEYWDSFKEGFIGGPAPSKS